MTPDLQTPSDPRRGTARGRVGAFPLALVLTMLVAGGLPDLRALELAGLPACPTGHPAGGHEGVPGGFGLRQALAGMTRVVASRARGMRAPVAPRIAGRGGVGDGEFGACARIPENPHAASGYLAREALIALPPPVA